MHLFWLSLWLPGRCRKQLPGETLVFKNGEVYINDKLLVENYLADKTNVWENGCVKEGVPYVVPSNEVFVMGDNRPRSSDSREFCSVPIDNLIGQVFYRYFPPDKVGPIRNPLR